MTSEREYRKSVDKVNSFVDQINGQYKENLSKLQGSDHSQITFMKSSLVKYGTILDKLGKCIRECSDNMIDGADIITADTDLRIFIDHNRSDNSQVQKEVFQ